MLLANYNYTVVGTPCKPTFRLRKERQNIRVQLCITGRSSGTSFEGRKGLFHLKNEKGQLRCICIYDRPQMSE